MAYTINNIQSHGFPLGIFTFSYALSGVATTDTAVAATEGKAVSLDTSAAITVKLAGDGDEIFGRVYKAENRAVLGIVAASVARLFKEKLPIATGHNVVVGDRVVGAGNGLVKKAGALPAGQGTIVVETGTDYVVVEKL